MLIFFPLPRQNSLLFHRARNTPNIYVFHIDSGRNGYIQDSLPLQIFKHCCFEWIFSHKFYNSIQFSYHFCFYHDQNMLKWKFENKNLFSAIWKSLWSVQKSQGSVSETITSELFQYTCLSVHVSLSSLLFPCLLHWIFV